MPVCEVSIVPVGTDAASYSDAVTRACDACSDRGVKHTVTAMATVLEGPLEDILSCAQAMHEAVLRGGCQRVVTHIAIDHRTDRPDSADRRVQAVGKTRA
ncbi:MAG TPA: MTH1187 family thiamine-binding protein [Bacillota bacterium]|nr:MTH1187 family thiamine-binding protein [Bacillota bacterium]